MVRNQETYFIEFEDYIFFNNGKWCPPPKSIIKNDNKQ